MRFFGPYAFIVLRIRRLVNIAVRLRVLAVKSHLRITRFLLKLIKFNLTIMYEHKTYYIGVRYISTATRKKKKPIKINYDYYNDCVARRIQGGYFLGIRRRTFTTTTGKTDYDNFRTLQHRPGLPILATRDIFEIFVLKFNPLR